jgi:threonyl-tRNA synthetase
VDKIPFMLIVGEKEEENNEVSVRKQAEGDLGTMSLEKFSAYIREEIDKELN